MSRPDRPNVRRVFCGPARVSPLAGEIADAREEGTADAVALAKRRHDPVRVSHVAPVSIAAVLDFEREGDDSLPADPLTTGPWRHELSDALAAAVGPLAMPATAYDAAVAGAVGAAMEAKLASTSAVIAAELARDDEFPVEDLAADLRGYAGVMHASADALENHADAMVAAWEVG